MEPFKSTSNLADHPQRRTAGSSHCTGFAQGRRAIPSPESLHLARLPCMTTPALVDRVAPLRSRFLFLSPFVFGVRRAPRKSGVGYETCRRPAARAGAGAGPDARRALMQKRDCVSCGQKVKRFDDYLKAQRSTNTAFFHWSCFLALMNTE